MTQIDMRQLQENIRGVISNLQLLGEAEDGREELAKVQATLDAVKADTATWRSELKEAKGQFDAMAQKARAKWAECERLDKDIETKRVELTAITQQLAKIRQQLGG